MMKMNDTPFFNPNFTKSQPVENYTNVQHVSNSYWDINSIKD